MTNDLENRWATLQAWLTTRFRKAFSVEGVLFLIGIQERGKGFEPKLEKEEKQDVIMEGTYAALAALGYYEPAGVDEQGVRQWQKVREAPELSVEAQEDLLKEAILAYFGQLFPESAAATDEKPPPAS